MSTFIAILSVIIFLYIVAMLVMSGFWRKAPSYDMPAQNYQQSISVILPVRNEENNVVQCLTAIEGQEFPGEKLEVIVVNDHSDDHTLKVIHGFCLQSDLTVVVEDLPADVSGKKKAIERGVNLATHELIVTTDADCSMNSKWLLSIAAYYHETGAKMIVGPVVYQHENTLFEKIQSVDFLAMAGFGSAAFMAGQPIMANGANLCFEKEAFREVGGYQGNLESVSGDDVFLLHKFKAAFPSRVKFLKSPLALVYTKPVRNLGAFIQQKLRWASKARYYKDRSAIIASGALFIVNIVLLIAMICLLRTGEGGTFAILMVIGAKLLTDLFFMLPFFTFSGKRKLILLFFPVQLFYPAYITGISIFAPFVKFSWKGRKSNFFS